MQSKNFSKIVNILYNEEIDNIDGEDIQEKGNGNINIEPEIIYDKFSGNMKVEFKIGKTKMYKIKNLAEFYSRMVNKENYKYREGLQFIHSENAFSQESIPLLRFILKYAEMIKFANSNSNSNYKYFGKSLNENTIVLGNSGIDEIFEILKNKEVDFYKEAKEEKVKFVEENPKIEFRLKQLSAGKYIIEPNIDIYKIVLIKGKDYKYILQKNKLYKCDKEFENTAVKLIEMFRQNYLTEVTLEKEELSQFFSIVLPKMKNAIKIKNIDEKELEEYKPKQLEIKVFFDFDKTGNIIADVLFRYGKEEFNPLDESKKINIPRNIIEETKALNLFRRTGFMFDTKNLRFILPDNDKIYDFISDGITQYINKFEVMVTDNFKTKQIKGLKIGNVGIKIQNDLLSINIDELNIDVEELKNIMEQYELKKKYYRLKDGSFLNLENNNEVEFFDKLVNGMEVSYKDIQEGEIKLPINRTMYLNTILKKLNTTSINKDEEYKKVITKLDTNQIEEIAIPEEIGNTLRYYQKTGFKWLKTLDNFKFGGILADDMGLGKTIQILSIILDYVKNSNENKEIIDGQESITNSQINNKKASLVIAPSSLTLNWQNEAKKFAPNLKVQVIRGKINERKELINQLQNYDMVITSYDLLKRDIDLYKEKDYKFRFIIADEAQYLKNSSTQNAKAIKELKSDTRYALTGTPIENSLAELWSIFDFIMPGYLYTYKKFKAMYEVPIIKEENKNSMEKLRTLIEPFVLRRTKKEVLTELPEKEVTVLESEMQEEQQEIYLSYLAEVKEDVANLIQENGYGKSQMKVLAALTRLRQICCYPGLFIKDYKGESSKLEQCLEIVEEAINGGHKILLFSSYTSMLSVIEEKFKEKNIKYFKLTGSTKVDERMNLVDEFNSNDEIKVFLISLKAGGTGLNLTGADMVIHYDPWWNVSTENQATDRAYRIGQKNNVQVYKLITKNSIEEKIYELQRKKETLIDNVLDTKTTFINKLSKEDLMSLFE
ncbi:MAG: SNF2 helicase associated domain-containing protein [Clostridia bacterium]|nr:SNF2 helicase associated domain-containing protein [Clostridia bacterium]